MKKSILEKTIILLSMLLLLCALPVGAAAENWSAIDPDSAPEEIHRIVLPGTTVLDLSLLLSADDGFKVTGSRMNGEELSEEALSAQAPLATGDQYYDPELKMWGQVVVSGDLDGDARVTSKDARTALQIAAEMPVTDDYLVFYAMDMNGDARHTSAEARTILRAAAKLGNVGVCIETEKGKTLRIMPLPLAKGAYEWKLDGDAPEGMNVEELLELIEPSPDNPAYATIGSPVHKIFEITAQNTGVYDLTFRCRRVGSGEIRDELRYKVIVH